MSRKVSPKTFQEKIAGYAILFILVIIVSMILFFMPIETIQIGNCGVKTQRLSLVFDNKQVEGARSEEVKRLSNENKIRESGSTNLSRGCSSGPQYSVYIL